MTTLQARVPASNIPGRLLAASLLVGGAVGFCSLPVNAEQPSSVPLLATAPLAAVAGAPTQRSAGGSDGMPPPQVRAIESAPSHPRNVLEAPGSAQSAVQPGTGASALSALSTDSPDVPWVLDSNIRPWTLAYAELIPLNALRITLPDEREARILLPGAVTDYVERARYASNRYVTDNIGTATLVRGRQLEAFKVWAENTAKQKTLLPKDPWAAYQFNKEALATAETFKKKIQDQTAPALKRVMADIQEAVSQVSPLMAVMGTYEQKMQWYNMLLQLKEGAGLYQARAVEADQQILAAIAEFEQANPPVARPVGTPPARPGEHVAPATAKAVTTEAGLTPAEDRSPAQPPVAPQKQSSQVGGALVLLGVAAFAIYLFMKLRSRLSKKKNVKE